MPQAAVQSIAEPGHVFELATGKFVGLYAISDYPTPPCCTNQTLYGDVSVVHSALFDDPARCANVESCKLCGDGPEPPCF